MKDSMFPRTLTRGILRGQTFQSSAEYQKALRKAKSGSINGRRIITKSGKARCAKCGEWKSAKRDFYPARKAASGIQSYCVACTTATRIANKRQTAKRNGTNGITRTKATSSTTWHVEVIRPDGTVIKADLPATEAVRLLGV